MVPSLIVGLSTVLVEPEVRSRCHHGGGFVPAPPGKPQGDRRQQQSMTRLGIVPPITQEEYERLEEKDRVGGSGGAEGNPASGEAKASGSRCRQDGPAHQPPFRNRTTGIVFSMISRSVQNPWFLT